MFKISVVASAKSGCIPICARVCRGGVAPILDVLPLQGAIVSKPGTWGGPRVSFTSFTLPWAEIPLPLQGATGSKPPSLCIRFALTLLREVRLHLSKTLKTSFKVLHSVCTDIALTGRHGFKCKKNFEHLLLSKKKEDLCYSLGRIWKVSTTV